LCESQDNIVRSVGIILSFHFHEKSEIRKGIVQLRLAKGIVFEAKREMKLFDI
jgi:hypothetical protein